MKITKKYCKNKHEINITFYLMKKGYKNRGIYPISV